MKLILSEEQKSQKETLKLILLECKADERRRREQPNGCDRLRREVQRSNRAKEAKREHSSVGLEHLPYKQRVGGSTPSAPTKSLREI